MSIQEKIGQKFMFGVNSHNIDIIVDLIKKYHIGGVILYKKNYNNYKEMLSVIKRLKEANKNNKLPLFISIDQEGGRVNRMPSEFNNIKNVYDMSSKNIDLVYENGKITGEMLSSMGINMNFAPVLDMCDDGAGKVLYKRCFCGNVDDVGDAGNKYVKGLYENKVISVVKHFPGHGASKMDSHFITPYVFNYRRIVDKHILPFVNSIDNGIDAMMLSHLVIRGMTDGLPASISKKFIKDYIRNKYGFNGLIITDEINMLSRNIFYTFFYLKKAFLASSDIILVKIINNKSYSMIDKFIKLVKDNKEYERELDDSVRRIINVKEKYNINDNISGLGCDIALINEKIDKLNDSVCK